MIYATSLSMVSMAMRLCLVVALLCGPLSRAQDDPVRIPEPFFSEIRPDFQELVLCIYQDSFGFMWLGTSRGLVRYDGFQVRWYRTDPDKEDSLSGAAVRVIHEDPHGNFWVGTNLGLNKMDRRTGTFKRFRHNPDDPDSLYSDTILDICDDRFGDLWICTPRGINRFTNGHLTRVPIPEAEGLVPGPATVDDDGNLWITSSSQGKLYRHFPRQDRFELYPGLPEIKISTLFPGSDGTLWLGTFSNGVFAIKDGEIKQFANQTSESDVLGSNYVTAIAEDSLGFVWIGTKKGITRISSSGATRLIQRHSDGRKGSLLNDSIRALYCSDGLMWVAADDSSIQSYDLNREYFHFFPGETSTLEEDSKGRLWIGKSQGLVQMDLKTGQRLSFQELGSVRSIMEWGDRLLVGTDQALLAVDPDTQEKEVLSKDQRFWRILDKGDGEAWIGTNHGVSILSADGKLSSLPRDKESGRMLTGPIITSLVKNSQGHLWVGSYDQGLFLLKPETHEVIRYVHNIQDPSSLGSDDILDLFLDREERLWVATQSTGLCRMNEDGQGFQRYATKNGFPDNAIAAVVQDHRNDFWINTGIGLVKLNPQNNTWLTYRSSDGVRSGNAVPGALIRLSDNSILMGGTSGFVRFSPQVLANPLPPKVVFTSVSAGGKELTQLMLPEETVRLSNDEKTFSLDFAVMDYRSPQQQKVAYKREGLDDEWVSTSTGRTVNYTRYLNFGGVGRLFVEGTSAIGLKTQAEITLEVEQPAWVTWLPLTLPGGLALLVGLIYVGISYRERIKRRQLVAEARLARQQKIIAEQRANIAERERAMEQEERRLQEERSMILHEHLEQLSTEIANELHDGPLGELHGLGFRLNALMDDQMESHQHKELQSCTRDLLPRVCADLRNICGDLLSPDFQFGLDTELDGYIDMVEDREGLKIERTLASDEAELEPQQMVTYFRICRTLLKNVAKHAQATHVRVLFAVEDDTIHLSIEDDGCGFVVPEDWESFKRNKHYGMYMANYFAESIGGCLRVDSTLGEGTNIEVYSPLNLMKKGVPSEAYSHRDS